jgi:UDP-N-acetylglucosamine transferase subunit ALG13
MSTGNKGETKQVLISVGTYTFNPLLEKMDSKEMMEVFKKHGYNRVVFQCGR